MTQPIDPASAPVSDPAPAPAAPPPDGPGPGWRPPRDRGGNGAAAIAGLVVLAIGIWYLLDHTLGLEMPRIDWGDAWPVFLVVIGAVMLVRSATRRT